MPASPLCSRHLECPECRSRNVLVVAVTATTAALHCLRCEHQFATETLPAQGEPAPPDERRGQP